MEMLGTPIPVPITETGLPLYVPVYPNMPRTLLKQTGLSKKVSAIHLARKGSPGNNMVSAISPFFASICTLITCWF